MYKNMPFFGLIIFLSIFFAAPMALYFSLFIFCIDKVPYWVTFKYMFFAMLVLMPAYANSLQKDDTDYQDFSIKKVLSELKDKNTWLEAKEQFFEKENLISIILSGLIVSLYFIFVVPIYNPDVFKFDKPKQQIVKPVDEINIKKISPKV